MGRDLPLGNHPADAIQPHGAGLGCGSGPEGREGNLWLARQEAEGRTLETMCGVCVGLSRLRAGGNQASAQAGAAALGSSFWEPVRSFWVKRCRLMTFHRSS